MKTTQDNKNEKKTLKTINAAARNAAKTINAAGRNLAAERKTLAETVRFLAASDSEDAQLFRELLALPLNANNTARRLAAQKIMQFLPTVIVYKYYNEAGVLTNIQKKPCTARGNLNVDTLAEVKKALANIQAKKAAHDEIKRLGGVAVDFSKLSKSARTALDFKQCIVATCEIYK